MWLWGCLGVSGCGDLAHSPQHSAQARPSPSVAFNPVAAGGRVAPIVQLIVSGLPASFANSDMSDVSDISAADGVSTPATIPVMIVQGAVSSSVIKSLSQGYVSDSVKKRIVPVETWPVQRDSQLLMPLEPLQLEQLYTVVVAQINWTSTFVVVAEDVVPVLHRVWPPADEASQEFGWCERLPNEGRVDAFPQAVELSPRGSGELRFGAADGTGASCVSLTVDASPEGPFELGADPSSGASQSVRLAPPVVLPMADGRIARAYPSPLTVSLSGPSASATTGALHCEESFERVGGLCAHVMDDRAKLSSDTHKLVIMHYHQGSKVDVVSPEASITLRGLVPESLNEVTVQSLSLGGQWEKETVQWMTSHAVSRVVINEVMANPVGPEPHQEWVELYNDGAKDAWLLDWQLQDSGGGVRLEPIVLRPGQFGVVVGQEYDFNSWLDTPIAESAIIIRVPRVAHGGITNSGEPLRLVDQQGHGVSSVPAIASKRAGESIARVTPDAPDHAPESFRMSPDGGTPGYANE